MGFPLAYSRVAMGVNANDSRGRSKPVVVKWEDSLRGEVAIYTWGRVRRRLSRCEQCLCWYEAKRKGQKYCDAECRVAAWRSRR